ncbi:MAG: chitinase [Acidobacteria bacterium]|nr:chitinase [Acidobacteriota bacterium]
MCLTGSVGPKGKTDNHREDVRLVQMMLNGNIAKLIPLAPLVEDGKIGDGTLGAIAEYQRRVLRMASPSNKVEPGSPTWKALKDGLGQGLTREKFRIIMYPASAQLIDRFFSHFAAALTANSINTALRQAHFLGQLGHESGNLRYTEEIASGSDYEGRVDLGNTQKGDGVRFKGRGLIQITGRSNYAAYGKVRGKDYITEPNNKILATDPAVAVDCSGWYWSDRGINAVADRDDIKAVTKIINGGTNGLEDRTQRTKRAKCILLPG